MFISLYCSTGGADTLPLFSALYIVCVQRPGTSQPVHISGRDIHKGKPETVLCIKLEPELVSRAVAVCLYIIQ